MHKYKLKNKYEHNLKPKNKNTNTLELVGGANRLGPYFWNNQKTELH